MGSLFNDHLKQHLLWIPHLGKGAPFPCFAGSSHVCPFFYIRIMVARCLSGDSVSAGHRLGHVSPRIPSIWSSSRYLLALQRIFPFFFPWFFLFGLEMTYPFSLWHLFLSTFKIVVCIMVSSFPLERELPEAGPLSDSPLSSSQTHKHTPCSMRFMGLGTSRFKELAWLRGRLLFSFLELHSWFVLSPVGGHHLGMEPRKGWTLSWGLIK